MMNLSIEKRNRLLVLYVKEKRIDAHNSEDLKSLIRQYLENGEINLIIDLEDVQFIDSSGLGALLSGYRNASSRQGGLVLSGLQTQVQMVFELTRLYRVFNIYTGINEALDTESRQADNVPK